MSKFDKFADAMSLAAEKIDGNKYLSVIKNAFSTFMPFIIVGSFASLGNYVLTNTTTGLARFSVFSFLTNLAPAFTALNFATMNIITLGIVVLMGILLARKNKGNELLSALVALSAYIAVVPQSTSVTVEEQLYTASGLPVASTNASGLFVGMILTLVVVELFNRLCNVERLKIKMPAAVPPAISRSFNALIPVVIILFIVGIAGRVYVILTGDYINETIYAILQRPMEFFLQTPTGTIGLAIFSQLFWAVGIHGGLVISAIRAPIMASALAENIEAVANGLTPMNPITMSTWRAFINIGGGGLVLSLAICLLLFSKREDGRAIGKLGLIPSIFSISEPIAFGLPLVLNPLYVVPYVLSAGVSSVIVILAFNIGFLTPNFVDVPYGLPIIINAFLGWGWRGVVVQIIIIAAGVLTYLPFVLVHNRQEVHEVAETGGEQ